jgi:hypothetical protein
MWVGGISGLEEFQSMRLDLHKPHLTAAEMETIAYSGL